MSGHGDSTTPRKRDFVEFIGEIVLLAVVGAFFIYLFVESFKWSAGAALMPRIAVFLGVPFLVIRAVVLLRGVREAVERPPPQIMDVGFRKSDDPKEAARRFFRICGFIVLLYAGIWLLGIHISLPLGIAIYLWLYSELRWYWIATIAGAFLALIVGVWDLILRATWTPPLLLDWLDLAW